MSITPRTDVAIKAASYNVGEQFREFARTLERELAAAALIRAAVAESFEAVKERDEALARVEGLRGYVRHKDHCRRTYSSGGAAESWCSCGLSAALAKNPSPQNCKDSGPGKGRCDKCAVGLYEECRYLAKNPMGADRTGETPVMAGRRGEDSRAGSSPAASTNSPPPPDPLQALHDSGQEIERAMEKKP